uniref:Peptidase C1A papain C-terminal domain-containing protein n=1 Tax=Acrobeloides nanus TaxID=290746 RepID=A0A914E893_9BILA
MIPNHSNYVGLLGLYMNYPDQSKQELVSCVSGSNCDGGVVNSALNYIKNNGQDTESSYPYAASNSACNPVASGKTKITSYWNVGTSEVNIAKQLPSTGPLILAFWLPPSFWYYQSGVFQPNAGDCFAVPRDDNCLYSLGRMWQKGGIPLHPLDSSLIKDNSPTIDTSPIGHFAPHRHFTHHRHFTYWTVHPP